jgi:hypothetical protein
MTGKKVSIILGILIPAAILVVGAFLLPGQLSAQAESGIESPASGDVISGTVTVEGTAWDADFLRYELAFYRELSFDADWIVFAQGDQTVTDGPLAFWDTTVGYPESPVFADGRYRLRLRVVRNDYNYDEYFVSGLVIANEGPTPTATGVIAETPTSGATPFSGTEVAATAIAGAGVIPTLTPFPTPSPLALPAEDPEIIPIGPEVEAQNEQPGILNQLLAIDTNRFGNAFWFGVRLVLFIFIALGLYWIFRSLFRRIRRYIRSRRSY